MSVEYTSGNATCLVIDPLGVAMSLSRRRVRCVLLSALATGVTLVSACGGVGDEAEGTTELRVADYLPGSDYHIAHGLKVFMEEAEKRSDGTITFEHYPAEQLAAAEDLLDATGSGLADIALLGVTYHTDKLPLAGVCALPGPVTTVTHATRACWQVTQEPHVHDEYLSNRVRPLYAHVNEPYGLQTTDAEVRSLEDLSGLKLRSGSGDQSKLISRMGATPVEMSGPETYEGVQRGTLDGILYPALSLPPYELGDPLEYGITGVNLGSFVHTAVINEDTWNDLTPDQQEALEQAGKKAMDAYATWVDENAGAVINQLEDDDEMTFYELPKAEEKRWADDAIAVSEQWAESLTADGMAGDEVWKAWTDAVHR